MYMVVYGWLKVAIGIFYLGKTSPQIAYNCSLVIHGLKIYRLSNDVLKYIRGCEKCQAAQVPGFSAKV